MSFLWATLPVIQNLSSFLQVRQYVDSDLRQIVPLKTRQTGATTQEVCFVDVDVWGAQGENCQKYLQKGRSVLVEGRLKLDTWEQDGQKRSRHSIVADRVTFMQGGQEEGESQSNSSAEDDLSAPAAASTAPATGEVDLKGQQRPFEDDLPF